MSHHVCLVSQDHGVKYYDNTDALTNRWAMSIAAMLVDIFTQFGPPKVLLADNGAEFMGAAGKRVVLTD